MCTVHRRLWLIEEGVAGFLQRPATFWRSRRHAMNWDTIKGQWKQVKGKVKEKWGKLTDDELDVIDGRKDQLIGKVQEKYGYTRDQAEREVDSYFESTRV
jgi:uncharacterized protein YjbJ (UPF0337 family)